MRPNARRRRQTILLLLHYAVVALVALAGLIAPDMAAAVFFLPLALVSLEEAVLWRDELSSAERADSLVFGVCALGLCIALTLGPLGQTPAAWVLGGLCVGAWTVWNFWRAQSR